MSEQKKISTTQLAKLLKLPSKLVFQLLHERKWIERQDNSWRLTGKGEFEGGEYKQSDKFGQYIVWPESIMAHRLFQQQDNILLSATRMGESVGVSARTVNAILAELGWMTLAPDGWKTTQIGQSLGGVDKENAQTGICYVLWPQAIIENQHFSHTVSQLHLRSVSQVNTLDGHTHGFDALQLIDNWLYIMGLNHACHRPIPHRQGDDSDLVADFYLPQHAIYIEYWGEEQNATAIKQKLEKQQRYKDLALNLIELNQQDLAKLEDVLSKALLKFGVQLYK